MDKGNKTVSVELCGGIFIGTSRVQNLAIVPNDKGQRFLAHVPHPKNRRITDCLKITEVTREWSKPTELLAKITDLVLSRGKLCDNADKLKGAEHV